MANTFQELSTLIDDRMAVCVFDACCPTRWVARSVATRTAKSRRNEKKTEDSETYSKHNYPVTSLDYAHIHYSYYICYNTISENHTSTSYPEAKHPKHNQLKVSCTREKPLILLVATDWDVTFALAMTFLCTSFRYCIVCNSLVPF